MASGKKRQKAAHQARKQQPAAGPFRHRDGDRRRRGGMTYEQGAAQKRSMQEFGAHPSDAVDEEE
jgi:hypothetical protein